MLRWISSSFGAVLFVHATLPASLAADAPIVRDPGVLYLADYNQEPLRLKVTEQAPGYFTVAMDRYLGALRAGQSVEVQAIAPKALRVKGQAQQGQILAWVDPKFLEPLPEGLVDSLKKIAERRDAVEALIAKNEIALGMTSGEVQRSLGRPDSKTSKQDKDSLKQSWEYVQTRNVPQQSVTTSPTGQQIVSTIYVKTVVGRLRVEFENDVVSAMEQTEGAAADETKVVVPPIILYY